MSVDAVVLIRPKKASMLRGVLDPDHAHAEVLDDGTIALCTFQRFAPLEGDPSEGIVILSAYGEGLVAAHDDPRGFFFYPDICEPRGRTYDAVVAEIGGAGVWVPARVLSVAEREVREKREAAHVEELMKAYEAMQRGEAVDDAVQVKLGIARAAPPAADIAELAAAMVRPEAMLALADIFAAGTLSFMLQRPSRRPVDGRCKLIEVTGEATLADGTVVIETNQAGRDGADLLAMSLGEWGQAWLEEHADPRGVPTFSSNELGRVLEVRSYATALEVLAEAVTFVRPVSIAGLAEERKARLRELLDGD